MFLRKIRARRVEFFSLNVLFFFCVLISYAYIARAQDNISGKWFPRVKSRGLNWVNKVKIQEAY